MRGVLLQVPEWLLEERRKLGQDKFDEVWDGELHMPPPPSSTHMRREMHLFKALEPIAVRRGLEVWVETGLFGPSGNSSNYRVPDVSVATPEQVSTRGLEGAMLVIELLSPHDESRAKFSFYAQASIREIWLIDPETREHQVHSLVDDRYVQIEPNEGVTCSPVLGIALTILAGKLRLRDGDYVADV